MQANNEKRRERTSSAVLFDVRAFVLALVVAMATMLLSGAAYAANGTTDGSDTQGVVSVATYEQLRIALEDTPGVKEVVIDPQAAADTNDVTYSVEDDEENEAFYIPFDGPLTVSHEITIKNAEDVDVYFARSNSFRRDQGKPALLNVDPSGSLNLKGLITMTGEEVTATFDEGNEETAPNFLFSVKTKDGTGEDNEVWNRGQLPEGGFYIQNNGGKVKLDGDVILADFFTSEDVKGVEPIYDNENIGLLFANRSAKSAQEEEAVEEETEEAEETAENTEEATEETTEATEETTEATETVEEPIIIAPTPKKSLRVLKSPALMTRTVNPVKKVATYDQLKAALEDTTTTRIIIDKSAAGTAVEINNDENNTNPGKKFYLPIDAPLTVNKAVEITATEDVIIARSHKFTSKEAIFKVEGSGDLNLTGKITMTGDQVAYEYVFPKVTFGTANLALGVRSFQYQLVNSGGLHFTLEDGLLFNYDNGKQYLGCYNKSLALRIYTTDAAVYQPAQARDAETGAVITSLLPGQKFKLYEVETGKYLKRKENTNFFEYADSLEDALEFTANAETTSNGQSVKTQMTFSVTNPVWTNEKVGAGELYSGYFIQVNNGKLKINDNVILTSLTTDASVKKVAPVVVVGSGAVLGQDQKERDDSTKNFVMNGGSIKGNKVGYYADKNLDSTAAVKTIANKIKGDNGTGLSNMTNTAGGVIFTDSATAMITGGTISGNKADAGGIIVTERAHVIFSGGGINSNIGVHHAGAAQVEHGGTLLMEGSAEMKNNIAWYKGGAVWATEWGTSGYAVANWSSWPKEFPSLYTDRSQPSSKGGGNFVMDGGIIQNNTAFARAGAIEVESNGVQLNAGLIDSNYCRSLGGAIYIEGDSPSYSYTLVLPKGYITENTAVYKTSASGVDYKDENRILDRKIGALNEETGSWLETNNNPGDNFDTDFNGAMGNGGGIWLCPVGGTSVFTGGDIYIWNNDAERNKGGEDFYLHKGNGSAMLQSHNLQGNWRNEVTNALVDKNLGVVSGPLSMTNEKTDYTKPESSTADTGVIITGNIARDGGAIACNGTFIIGEAEDVHRFNARLDMTKTWANGTDPTGQIVNLKLQYKVKNGTWKDLTYVNAETTGTYSVDLNGSADVGDGVGSDIISETAPIDSRNWTAAAFIPLYIMDGSDKVYLYTLKNPYEGNYSGENTGTAPHNVNFANIDVLDLSNEEHVGHLYKYIDAEQTAGRTPSIQVAQWNLQIVETIKTGNNTYHIEELKPTTGIGSGTADTITLTDPVQVDANGKPVVIDSFSITYSTVTFGYSLTNKLNSVDVELYKKDNYDTGIPGIEFIVAEAHLDDSGDYRFAGDENKWSENESDDHGKTYEDNSVKVTSATSSGSNGYFKIEGLTPGTDYFLFENTTNDKYKAHTAPWLIKVAANGKVTVHAIDSDYRDKVKYHRGNILNYTDKKVWHRYWNKDWFSTSSSTTIVNDWKLYVSAKIVKTTNDGETPVPGAKFAFSDVSWKNADTKTTIYAGSGGVIKNANNQVVIEETGDDGVINFTNVIKALRMTDNPGGLQGTHIESEKITLLMYEIKPGTGHRMKTAPWLVIIDEDGNVTVKEYKNPYVYSVSPINENGTWNSSVGNTVEAPIADFGQTAAAISTGTLTEYASVTNEPIVIKLTKIGSESTEQNLVKLDGAEFRLYKAQASSYKNNGEPYGNFTITDKNPIVVDPTTGSTVIESKNGGEIILPITEPGEYILYETKAPTGYKRSVVPWGIWVKSDYTAVGYPIKVGKLDEVEGWILDEENDPLEIPLTCDYFGQSSQYIKNDIFNVELTKTDAKGQTLDGAIFELYKVTNLPSGKTVDNLIDADWTTTFGASDWDMEKGDRVAQTTEIKSKDGGKIALPITEEGIYFLFETAPTSNDYVVPTDPWVIVVTDYGKVVVRRSDGVAKTGDRWWKAYKYSKLQGTTIVNNEQIKINKVKGKFNGNALELEKTTAVNGAEFKLFYATKEGNKRVKGDPVPGGENIKSVNGVIELPTQLSLLSGDKDYWLEETAAAPGYVKEDKPWVLWVKDGRLHVIYRYKVYDGSGKVDNNATNYVEAYRHDSGEEPYIHNEQYILKVDKNTLSDDEPNVLSDAKFTLYKAYTDGTWVRRRTVAEGKWSLESDSQGRIYLPTSVTSDPRTEGYFLVEDTAPDSFKKASAPWWIKVMSDGSIEIWTTNREKRKTQNGFDLWYVSDYSKGQTETDKMRIPNTPGDLTLTKVDGYTNAGLQGASFEIYRASDVSRSYSGSNFVYKVHRNERLDDSTVSQLNTGKFSLPSSMSTDGFYIMFEKTAPKDYAKEVNPWLVKVFYDYGARRYYARTWVLIPYEGETDVYRWKYEGVTGVSDGCDDRVRNYPSVNLIKVDLHPDKVTIGQNIGDLTITDDSARLKGVEFRLYSANWTSGNWNKKSTTPLKIVMTNDEGEFITSEVIKSGDNGVVELGRLDPSSYYILEEEQPLEGYVQPDHEWRIVTDAQGKIERLRVWDGTGYITATNNIIVNVKEYDLPKTGGMGTYWFMVIGAMMMGFALTAGFTKIDLLSLLRR